MKGNELTALEWLIDEHFGGIENCTPDFKNKINQAKEIEKEQSIELIRQTAMFMAAADFDEDIAKMTFEDVYETLKQEKQ